MTPWAPRPECFSGLDLDGPDVATADGAWQAALVDENRLDDARRGFERARSQAAAVDQCAAVYRRPRRSGPPVVAVRCKGRGRSFNLEAAKPVGKAFEVVSLSDGCGAGAVHGSGPRS